MTKFLDKTGLAYFWEKVKAWIPFLSRKTQSIPFGQVDSTSTSTVFTATVDGITELRDGVCCYLRNGVVTSASGYTININGLGAKPVYQTMAAATRTSTLFNVNYTFLFIYNSSRVEGGCWDAYYGYYSDSNNLGIYIRTNSMSMPVSDYTGRYRLLFTSVDGSEFVPSTTSTATNTTSLRDVNQRPIDPFGSIILYNSTTALNAGSRPSAAALFTQYPFTLGYSFNRTGAALTLTPWAPVYIKCAPQSNGSAIIDADTPYVQSLPTTEDGKIYIFLGVAYSATQVDFVYNHPIYYYKDGAIREWTNAAETDVSGKADKVVGATNGHLAGLDATGNLTDSGHSASDFALNSQVTTKIVVDDIMNIPPRTVDNLQVGDIVAEHIDNGDGESWVEDTYNEYVVSYRNDQSAEGVYSGSLFLDRIDSVLKVVLIRVIYTRYAEEDWDCTTQKYVLSGIETNVYPNNNKYTVFTEDDASYLRNLPLTGNVSIIAISSRDTFYLSPIFFRFSFDTGNTVPNVTWPSQISYWKGGSAPTLQPNTHYEIVVYGRQLGGASFSAFAECLSTADDTVDISGKADKVSGAVSGNFAGLDATGNLTDSGYSASDFVSSSSLPAYTIARLGTPETGYFASYVLQKDGVQEGATINIPKDYLVKSGSVIDVVEYNGQYYDATDTTHTTPLPVSAAGKYLDFVVNTVDSSGASSHIYIAVNDLVDAYTEGNGIDISNLNVVSIQIDSSNSNGLSVSSNGLALATAVASSSGTGGSNGAMTAADKEKLNGLRKMVVLEYGVSTWSDFQNAFNDNAVVYCKASSNSNPATGDKRRYAFLAYNGGTNVEFQYYRSVSSHSATQQGDQVFIYKLTNANAWSVETREAYTKIVAGTNLTSSYSNGALTINAGAISDKADKVSGATSGNFAGLDSSGNLTDSGSKASDFATASQGVPSGGTAGQVLAKHSNTDNDLEWTDPSGGSSFAFEIVGNNLQVTYGDAQNPNFSITNNHLIVTL